jgi:hypothetical protein
MRPADDFAFILRKKGRDWPSSAGRRPPAPAAFGDRMSELVSISVDTEPTTLDIGDAIRKRGSAATCDQS